MMIFLTLNCFTLFILLHTCKSADHYQYFINSYCGISYSYPTWSMDISKSNTRSVILKDLADVGINIIEDYKLFYPNCSNIQKEFIEISALYPLLSALPNPLPLSALKSRTIFISSLDDELWLKAVISLLRFGVVVIDGILPFSYKLSKILDDAKLLYNLNLFKKSKTLAAEHLNPVAHTGSGGMYIPSFRSDEYLWLDSLEGRLNKIIETKNIVKATKSIANLQSFHDALMIKVTKGLNSIEISDEIKAKTLPTLISTTSPLLTCFGCTGNSAPIPHRYGAHMDSSNQDAQSKLSVSSLYYLSKNTIGGELRIGLLDPMKDIDGTIDIVPKQGRMVLFLSKHTPHSVEGTYTPRYTLTSFLRPE